MVSIVNGYVCNNCSEAAEARKGRDPHAKPGEMPGDDGNKTSAYDDQPATVLGGALKGLLIANPVTAATESQETQNAARQSGANPAQAGFDLLV